MNKNFDLVKILKNAPKGTKLWSPLCGECKLIGVKEEDNDYPILCKANDGCNINFTNLGKFYKVICTDGECVLFPSKENRDWSKFKVSKEHKHFEPYQKVLVKAYSEPYPNHKIWLPDIYLFYEEQNSCHRVAINKYVHNDDNIISYEGNEEKAGKNAE